MRVTEWFVEMLMCLALAAPVVLADVMTPSLTARPKASIAGMEGSVVTLRLSVDGEYACMGRRVYWPDDTRSYHEADCDPDDPPVHDSETWRRRFGPGEYTVCVGLEQPEGKTRKKVCDTFSVK